jgi:signal transduction histidine kinase/ActR/RegA family two-component response regulator
VPVAKRRFFWALAFIIALSAILSIGFVSYAELSDLADSSASVQRSYDVLQTLDDLDGALTDSETNQRGYLLTRDPSYLTQYDAAVAQIRLAVSELRRLSQSELSTANSIAELSRLANAQLDELQRTVHETEGGDRATLAHMAEGGGTQIMSAFRRFSADLDASQRHLLEMRRAEEHDARMTSEAVLIGTIVLSLIFVGAAAVISRRFDERRRQLEREIAERRRAEEYREALLVSERAARSEAERATRLKDEFVATLSHELRTPLNAIVGWASILRSDRRAASVSQGLEVIERNAKAQAQMIEDLLDMSRIVSGKLRIDLQLIDPAAVVKAAAASIRPSADVKGIAIHAAVEPVGMIYSDAGRLQQIIWNLLTNAIKFTAREGIVRVALVQLEGQAELSVSDTGQGIPPEFLPYVFDRFRQADASTTRRHGGLGLGLSIVKSLVDMHGGSVDARSDGEGQGATFTVRLPLVRAQPPMGHLYSTASILKPERSADHDEVTLSGLRVLVVDDEPDARALARRVLEERGADVVTVASAPEALAVVDGDRAPSVVVSDIGMPDEDGYDFIRKLRALPGSAGRIPAVALTALARNEDRKRALLAGYQTHISKPVDPAELVAVIARITDRPATRTAVRSASNNGVSH